MPKLFLLIALGTLLAGLIVWISMDPLNRGELEDVYPEEVLPRGDAL